MKSIHLKAFMIFLLFIQSTSCTKDSLGIDIKKEVEIETRSKSQKQVSPYTLLFQKEIFEFDSKRELYSFLAKKDPSTAIYLAEVIISDLNKEYIEKYGDEYAKDLKIWKSFEKDLEDEFEVVGLPSSYRCLTCTVYPEQCEDDLIYISFAPEYFQLRVYDDANYSGENNLFDDSKTILMVEYDPCEGIFGTIEIPSLTTRGTFWNNKISSFKLDTELWHESAILTLYSEIGLTGSEFVYHMSEDDTKVWESDLSDNFWRIRNIPFSVDNRVSSVGLKFNR